MPEMLTQNIEPVVQLTTILLSIAALTVALYRYRTQKRQLHALKWSQVSKTFDLLILWFGSHMTESRRAASQYYEYESVEPVDVAELTELDTYDEAMSHFFVVLNYLDLVCLAYLKRVIDPDLCFNYLGNVVINHYVIFGPLIHHLRGSLDVSEDPSLRTFGHLELVAEEWLRDLSKDSDALRRARLSLRYDRLREAPMDDGS